MNREQYVFPRRPVQAGDRDAPDMSPCMILLLSEDKLFHFSSFSSLYAGKLLDQIYYICLSMWTHTQTHTHTLKKNNNTHEEDNLHFLHFKTYPGSIHL